jgi:hypothetical protein
VNLFYETTSRGFKTFIIKNWKSLSIFAAVIILGFIFFRKPIRKWYLNRKLGHLQTQKSSLNSLVKKLQKDYFAKKTLSELAFSVKMKKFKEMIIDIERQIPLLREDLARLSKRKV